MKKNQQSYITISSALSAPSPISSIIFIEYLAVVYALATNLGNYYYFSKINLVGIIF